MVGPEIRPVVRSGFEIPGWEDADLDQFEDLSRWRFFEVTTPLHGNNYVQLHAAWRDPGSEDAPDEVQVEWNGGSERYWGVVEMHPARWHVVDGCWERRP